MYTKVKSQIDIATEQSKDLGFLVFVDDDEIGTLLNEKIATFCDLSFIAASKPHINLDSKKLSRQQEKRKKFSQA